VLIKASRALYFNAFGARQNTAGQKLALWKKSPCSTNPDGEARDFAGFAAEYNRDDERFPTFLRGELKQPVWRAG
jgi:hypothetical protein